MKTFRVLVCFYDESDNLIAEESLEFESIRYGEAMNRATEWANTNLKKFGADYYSIY